MTNLTLAVSTPNAPSRRFRPDEDGKRVCRKCGELKLLEDFNRDSRSTAGRRRDCKKCGNEYRAAWARARYVPRTNRHTFPRDVDGKRVCRKCGEVKPIDEFYPEARTKGGHKHECKQCVRSRYVPKTGRRYDVSPEAKAQRAAAKVAKGVRRHLREQRSNGVSARVNCQPNRL